jgi:hypothetical protein
MNCPSCGCKMLEGYRSNNHLEGFGEDTPLTEIFGCVNQFCELYGNRMTEEEINEYVQSR